jgi:hypothetical protein
MSDLFKPDFVLLLVCIGVMSAMWAKGKLPHMSSLVTLFNALNTRGGNIALLSLMVIVFTSTAMRYIYFIVGLEVAGKLTRESAVAMNGFTFVTGSVCGLAMGAWLKAMSPQDMPVPPGTTSRTTTSIEATTGTSSGHEPDKEK